MLSNESKLLAAHWETVEDILAAERKLREELSTFLRSFENRLVGMDWWGPDWHFVKHDDQQVYIAHSKWRNKREFALWIGVERFDPCMLFGKESMPQLYLWANGDGALALRLRAMVAEKRISLPGELAKGQYIVRRFIRKCLPQDVDRFEEFVRSPILDFFSECARQEAVLSAAVSRRSKK